MTRRRLFLIPAMVFLALWSWHARAQAAAQWTFMVYMIADNNLECGALDEFKKMAAAGSDSNINIVAQFDRGKGFCDSKDNEYDDWTTCKRFYITPGMNPFAANALEDLGEINMCDPNTLREFINWATSNFPANRYALVIMNHGGGFSAQRTRLYQALPYAKTAAEKEAIRREMVLAQNPFRSIGPDDDPGASLSNRQIKQALQAANTKVNLLYFDACEMAYLETAYELKDAVLEVLVASEPLSWGNAYDLILNELKKDPAATPRQLAQWIVDYYYTGNDHEMAAIDLTKIESLANSVSLLGNALRSNWNVDQNVVKTAATNVMLNIKSTVFWKSKDIPVFRCNGLKIWFPNTKAEYDSSISTYHSSEVDFGLQTTWYQFLEAYFFSMGASWVKAARSGSQQFQPDDVDLYDFCRKLTESPPNLAEAVDFPLLTWSTGGAGELPGWIGQTSTYVSDKDAAQSLNRQPNTDSWLRTIVTGPGRLDCAYKVSSELIGDRLSVSIDGKVRDYISGENDWAFNIFDISPGKHVVEWHYTKDGSNSAGMDCGWVDKVFYNINYNHALDTTGIDFAQTGGHWVGQDRIYRVGDSAIQFFDDHQLPYPSAWLTANLSGPGVLYFYWKVSSKTSLMFNLDLKLKDSISGEVDWKLCKVAIPTGTHRVDWIFTSKANSGDTAWVDGVLFLIDVGLNQALDNEDLTFATGGDSSWIGQTQTSYYGGSAARSGPLDDNGSAWMKTMVIGPGKVSFFWRVSSEDNFDKLKFAIDRATLAEASGEVSWVQKTFDVPPGAHLLRWTYTKDASGNKGSDCGWVDKVEYAKTGGDLSPVMLLLDDD